MRQTRKPRAGETYERSELVSDAESCFLPSTVNEENKESKHSTPLKYVPQKRATILGMDTSPASVIWEAPEHHHTEKSSDWFWVLGIVGIAGASASFIFGNVLFGIVIILGTVTMALVARQEPKMMEFEVSSRGIRAGSSLYPYKTLESYAIDFECGHGPQLIAKSKQLLMPLIILPLPTDQIAMIDNILINNLPSEHLEEPLSHKILELFGF